MKFQRISHCSKEYSIKNKVQVLKEDYVLTSFLLTFILNTSVLRNSWKCSTVGLYGPVKFSSSYKDLYSNLEQLFTSAFPNYSSEIRDLTYVNRNSTGYVQRVSSENVCFCDIRFTVTFLCTRLYLQKQYKHTNIYFT